MIIEPLQNLQKNVSDLSSKRSGPRTGLQRSYSKVNYAGSRISSTRPNTGKGVTFHFQHKYISKTKNQSASNGEFTTAAKHQSYIEREEANEQFSEHIENSQTPQNWTFSHADSFGNIGNNKSEREEFWRKVEQSEGRKGRVQCRMIIELPHECDQNARREIAQNFCRTLEEKGLPFWCALHAPYGDNDPRNHHMHIIYHDRPTQKINDKWDFEIVERVKGSNRITREKYPYKQNKDRECQGKEWIKYLRQSYAQSANEILRNNHIEKQYDPRSYQEAGLFKEPTQHLGTQSNVVERGGGSTRRGDDNTQKERIWQESQPQRNLEEEKQWIQNHQKSYNIPNHELIALEKAMEEKKSIEERIIQNNLDIEENTLRIRKRMLFLNQEEERLKKPTVAEAADKKTKEEAIHYLQAERNLAQKTQEDIERYIAQQKEIQKEEEKRRLIIQEFIQNQKEKILAKYTKNEDKKPTRPRTLTQENFDEFETKVPDLAEDKNARKARKTRKSQQTQEER